jgi:hypothetical protein
MTPATAATAEAPVLQELEILAFQYWDIEVALNFMLLACADLRP